MSLLPSTHQNNLKVLRGIAKFAPKNTDGTKQSAIAMSPAAEFAVTVSSSDATYTSAESGVNEILDRTVISVDRTAKLTCNNLSDEIKALFIVGDATSLSQTTASVADEVTAYVVPGRSIQLGGTTNNGAGIFGVSAVTVEVYEGANAATAATTTAYGVGAVVVPATPNNHWYMATVAGTSGASAPTWPTGGGTVTDGTVTWQDMGLIAVASGFEVDTDYGVVNVLATGLIADAYAKVPASIRAAGKGFRLSVSYTRAAKTVSQIATKGEATLEGEFWFYEQNPKGSNSVWYAPSCTLSPDGDFNLKSGTDYGSVGFGLAFQKPATQSAIYINGVPA